MSKVLLSGGFKRVYICKTGFVREKGNEVFGKIYMRILLVFGFYEKVNFEMD